jgi:hypothetical protein
MKDLILRAPDNNRKQRRCLSCGTTQNMGRKKYCSIECRQTLRSKLDMRTGLLQALNTRYATFYFSDIMIIMDILPYGFKEICSFFYPRSPGARPGDDFSTMSNILGESWWAEKHRTNKRYLASMHVLTLAHRNGGSANTLRPYAVETPQIKTTSLVYLNLSKSDLYSPELSKVVKSAYRRQAKIYHPDLGGDATVFRKINQAYDELTKWADNPSFVRRRGFPDKWFYDGSANRWLQPAPTPQNSIYK